MISNCYVKLHVLCCAENQRCRGLPSMIMISKSFYLTKQSTQPISRLANLQGPSETDIMAQKIEHGLSEERVLRTFKGYVVYALLHNYMSNK
jgi:hypothetical protein